MMDQASPSLELTPQFCFSTVALRGSNFLRTSRSSIDDSIAQNLNALLTPASTGFDPSSTSARILRPSNPRQLSPQSCQTFKSQLLFPSWQMRSDVLNYCASVATSPDPDDPETVQRRLKSEEIKTRVVDERLDPYSSKFYPTEARTERLAALVRQERGVENIIRARSWGLVRDMCGDDWRDWEEALNDWRKGREFGSMVIGGQSTVVYLVWATTTSTPNRRFALKDQEERKGGKLSKMRNQSYVATTATILENHHFNHITSSRTIVPNPQSNLCESLPIMADAPAREIPLNSVQIEALVVMKIVKACSATFPTTATGSIVGMDINGTLQITNCFPFPTADVATSDSHPNDHMAASNAAAAAPRSKANILYQNEMIKYLREVNVDANNVGWYMSANMGNFINSSLIENQFHYQEKLNERTVALVHDVSRSSQGALSLRAFRLSSTFMAAFKESKFTTEHMQKSKLTYKDVLVELPIIVHNSHLLTSFLHQMPGALPEKQLELPASLSDLTANPPPIPLYPNLESLDLSVDPFLERTCDQLLDSIETHYTELNNFQYFQRQLAREQTKITAWKTKRAAENALRATQKLAPLPEDELERLFKLPTEPSRLEGMLNARQVEQYSRQVDGFTASITSKMFAVKSNLLPDSE
ncbi:eukaryotic translation initiation factor 3 subunit H [Diplocarpon rosae]|nr:eukaryotic translation initiation factor 3 subunit H [Diplocarpon rosae]